LFQKTVSGNGEMGEPDGEGWGGISNGSKKNGPPSAIGAVFSKRPCVGGG